jgi:hypothetical protein
MNILDIIYTTRRDGITTTYVTNTIIFCFENQCILGQEDKPWHKPKKPLNNP